MKTKTIVLSVGLLIAVSLITKAANASPALATNYDEKLAEKLGADDYGMRSYVFCLLKTGTAKIEDAARRKEIFQGHFANMAKLAQDRKLVFAGPFGDAEPWRGMYIFDVEKLSDAEALVKTDPAVAAGVFDYELKKIYGSAALRKMNEIHAKIQKKAIK